MASATRRRGSGVPGEPDLEGPQLSTPGRVGALGGGCILASTAHTRADRGGDQAFFVDVIWLAYDPVVLIAHDCGRVVVHGLARDRVGLRNADGADYDSG